MSFGIMSRDLDWMDVDGGSASTTLVPSGEHTW